MKKVIPGKIKTQLRLDGYYNVLNKYGTQHDSTEYYQWATGAAVTDAELADLYAGNGLFSTIIDAPADDATKNGIDLGIKDKDLQKRLDDHLQTIHYQSKLAKALKWARLFGGSAVVMLVDDGRLLQDPLNWRDVHGVEELLVYGRNEGLRGSSFCMSPLTAVPAGEWSSPDRCRHCEVLRGCAYTPGCPMCGRDLTSWSLRGFLRCETLSIARNALHSCRTRCLSDKTPGCQFRPCDNLHLPDCFRSR